MSPIPSSNDESSRYSRLSNERVKDTQESTLLAIFRSNIRAPQIRASDDESDTEQGHLPKHSRTDAQNIDLILNIFESKPGYEVPQLLASRIGPGPMSVTSQKEMRVVIPG